jgi:hypothetical protein
VRRILAGSLAFFALSGTFLILPVYAAPAPEAKPVETSIDTVELGSLVAPARAADVAPAEDVQPDVVGTVPDGAPADAEPVAATDPVLTVSRSNVDEFSAVGVTWSVDPDVTDVKVRLRTQAGSRWGDWTDLGTDDVEQTPSKETAPEDVRAGTAPYWTGPSTGVEVQLSAASGAQPRDVELELIDPGESDADAVPGAPAAREQAHAATGMPPVYGRAQWGANEAIRTWDPEYAPTIKAATLHHTADGNGYTADQVPAMMRSIYSYHAQSRGWGDIGYNVIVDKFGRIWEGRYGGLSSTVIGAHAGGFNTGTFGVSMLGNYAEVDTPAVMLDAVAAIMAWKLGLYGVDPNAATQLTSGGGGTSKYPAGQVVTLPTIFAHRDVGSTTCPGQYAYNRMGQLRSAVSARIAPPSGSPIGNLERFSLSGDVLSVVGWTFDPDNPSATVPIDLLIDGIPAVEWPASGVRGDVGAVYPAAGANHGFSATHQLPLGEHSICVVALNIGATGGHNWMACRQMTIKVQPPPVNPFGNVEGIRADDRTISTQGWTIDPDAQTSALDVHVYVNGGWGGALVADGSRPDVAAVYPAAGPAHGFTWSLQVNAPGDYRICVYAINKNAGTTNPELGCGTVRVSAASWDARGHADSAVLDGPTVTLSGWALDADTPTTPLDVHIYVDGRFQRSIKADRSRPDVGGAFPGMGDAHGYTTSLDLPPGVRWICAYAINTGLGATNPALGCHAVTVPMAAWNPFGNLDVVQRAGGVVNVNGWALDPDTRDQPIQVHLYVDGRGYPTVVTADRDRPDVGAVFPGAGPAHGYSASIALPPGQQTVCAYAINTGYGTHNPLMTCRTLPG